MLECERCAWCVCVCMWVGEWLGGWVSGWVGDWVSGGVVLGMWWVWGWDMVWGSGVGLGKWGGAGGGWGGCAWVVSILTTHSNPPQSNTNPADCCCAHHQQVLVCSPFVSMFSLVRYWEKCLAFAKTSWSQGLPSKWIRWHSMTERYLGSDMCKRCKVRQA